MYEPLQYPGIFIVQSLICLTDIVFAFLFHSAFWFTGQNLIFASTHNSLMDLHIYLLRLHKFLQN